jgi:hypothetical protein
MTITLEQASWLYLGLVGRNDAESIALRRAIVRARNSASVPV